MKNITRTITIATVEIMSKKNLLAPLYVTKVCTDDETEAEKLAIKEYLAKYFGNDDERKKAKNTVFGIVTDTAEYKGELPLETFVQNCIDWGTLEKIEKIED